MLLLVLICGLVGVGLCDVGDGKVDCYHRINFPSLTSTCLLPAMILYAPLMLC